MWRLLLDANGYFESLANDILSTKPSFRFCLGIIAMDISISDLAAFVAFINYHNIS